MDSVAHPELRCLVSRQEVIQELIDNTLGSVYIIRIWYVLLLDIFSRHAVLVEISLIYRRHVKPGIDIGSPKDHQHDPEDAYHCCDCLVLAQHGGQCIDRSDRGTQHEHTSDISQHHFYSACKKTEQQDPCTEICHKERKTHDAFRRKTDDQIGEINIYSAVPQHNFVPYRPIAVLRADKKTAKDSRNDHDQRHIGQKALLQRYFIPIVLLHEIKFVQRQDQTDCSHNHYPCPETGSMSQTQKTRIY